MSIARAIRFFYSKCIRHTNGVRSKNGDFVGGWGQGDFDSSGQVAAQLRATGPGHVGEKERGASDCSLAGSGAVKL